MEKDYSDHDLLIRMDERLEILGKSFSNHLRHHWMVTIPLLVVVLGLVAKIMWL